jgi:TPR repeat protein
VLKALGLRDGAPDISQARLWYDRAANLGSADASLRLQQLATTSSE